MSPDVTEKSLLERTAAGDPTAVRECIDRYGGLVWSLARRFVRGEAEAEDAVQEIFLELWKHAGRFNPGIASETAFVAMIARRRLIDRRRKAATSREREALDEGREVPSAPSPDPGELSEEASKARAALEKLSGEQQKVLRLAVCHGLSHERIAKAFGLPLGTVKTHARRGLLRLRSLLQAQGAGGSGGIVEGDA